jgi:uncharacterized protein (TIGR02246 family)
MQVSDQTKNQIMTLLYRLSQACRQNDLEAILSLFDSEFHGIGIVSDEKIIGTEGLRRKLEQELARGETCAIEYSDVRIRAEGTIAWVMSDITLYMTVDGSPRSLHARMTLVLRGTGHAWVIAQWHISQPVGKRNQR